MHLSGLQDAGNLAGVPDILLHLFLLLLCRAPVLPQCFYVTKYFFKIFKACTPRSHRNIHIIQRGMPTRHTHHVDLQIRHRKQHLCWWRKEVQNIPPSGSRESHNEAFSVLFSGLQAPPAAVGPDPFLLYSCPSQSCF